MTTRRLRTTENMQQFTTFLSTFRRSRLDCALVWPIHILDPLCLPSFYYCRVHNQQTSTNERAFPQFISRGTETCRIFSVFCVPFTADLFVYEYTSDSYFSRNILCIKCIQTNWKRRCQNMMMRLRRASSYLFRRAAVYLVVWGPVIAGVFTLNASFLFQDAVAIAAHFFDF